ETSTNPIASIFAWTRGLKFRGTFIGRAVEGAAELEPAGPGKDRGDRVGRGLLALLVLAVVAGDGAVRRLGFDRLAVRRHQHRGHHAERAETLGQRVGLHVAVVILGGPD